MCLGASSSENNIPDHCSLFWGMVMKASGFLSNLRFLGNYEKSTIMRARDDGGILTDRRFDVGGDSVMKLIIELFPSNTSGRADLLESSWDIPHNLGHYLGQTFKLDKTRAIRQSASLMLRAEAFRSSLFGVNPFIPSILQLVQPRSIHEFFQRNDTIKNSLWARVDGISDLERVELNQNSQYLLNKRMGLKGFNTLLVNAIRDEVSAGYQQFTVEHSILAFICDFLSDKDDAQFLLREWSRMRSGIFLPDYLERGQNIPSINREVLFRAAKDTFAVLMSSLHGLPYYDPAPAGPAGKWIVSPDGVVPGSGEFSDCVESSIRHLFNYALGGRGISAFNKDAIRERVKARFPHEGQLRERDRLSELENFYRTFHNPNDGSAPARSQWNLMTFGLNSEDEMDSPYYVAYSNEYDIPSSGNELESNICNVLKAVGGILGIRASAIMNGVNNLDDVLARLNELLNIINDSNDYTLKVNSSSLAPDIYSYRSSVAINVDLLQKNNDNVRITSSFVFNSLPGHGFVSSITRPILPDFTDTLNSADRSLLSYFFEEYPGQSLYSNIFSLKCAKNYRSILMNTIHHYEDTSRKELQTALQTVIGKVMGRVVFTDENTAPDMYKKILLASRFNNTTYQMIRHMAHDPITFPPDLRQVLMYVQTVDVPSFDMSHNDGFTESLGISGRISPILLDGRIPNHLKQLQLLTLRKVNGADFT
ncbi:MAG: hypothetical protein LBJ92_03845, partial [Holosporales bacterium]|nr:hypothetical protein [Holosporales bacterium]